MANDILDKKATTADIFSVGTIALALRFLQAENRKQIRITGLI